MFKFSAKPRVGVISGKSFMYPAQQFDCVIIDSFGKLGCKAEELD